MGKIATAWLAAGLLLVAACGDDGEDSDDTEASSATPEDEVEWNTDIPFCAQFGDLEGKWGGVQEVDSTEVLDDFEDLEAPEEIAAEWDTFMEGFEVQAGFPEPDPEDEEAVADYQEKVTSALEDIDQTEFNDAMSKIDAFVTGECLSGGDGGGDESTTTTEPPGEEAEEG